MKTTLEVKEDGQIFVIDGMPEEPKIRETNQFMYPDEKKRVNAENYAYEKALASANRIPVANHNDAFFRIQDQYMPKGAKEFKLKPGIYSLPDVEWEKKDEIYMDNAFRSRIVAILKESPKEQKSDNELIAEFMGDKPSVGKDLLLYHSSWSWLINVIRKCRTKCRGKWSDKSRTLYNDIESCLLKLEISPTYAAVVEFIKWHNSQKP